MQRGFAPILILVIVGIVVLAGVGGWWWKNNQSPGPGEQMACTADAKICPDGSGVGRTGPNCEFAACPTPSASASADWKTYTGVGFSFNYPNYLEMQSSTNGDSSWGMKDTTGNFVPNQMILHSQASPFTDTRIGGLIKVGSQDLKIEVTEENKDITLSGQTVKRLLISCGVDCEYYVLDFQSNKKYYQLIFFAAGGGLSTKFDQILESFKFNLADTANWKTYKNAKLSFQYPADWKISEDKSVVFVTSPDTITKIDISALSWSDPPGCGDPNCAYFKNPKISFMIVGKKYETFENIDTKSGGIGASFYLDGGQEVGIQSTKDSLTKDSEVIQKIFNTLKFY